MVRATSPTAPETPETVRAPSRPHRSNEYPICHLSGISYPRNTVRSIPLGVRAGEPIPTDPSAIQLVDISSNGKVTQTFPGTDASKTAVYRLRWLNTRNEKGPWGLVVTATIAA